MTRWAIVGVLVLGLCVPASAQDRPAALVVAQGLVVGLNARTLSANAARAR
jgi:hypothetical protein